MSYVIVPFEALESGEEAPFIARIMVSGRSKRRDTAEHCTKTLPFWRSIRVVYDEEERRQRAGGVFISFLIARAHHRLLCLAMEYRCTTFSGGGPAKRIKLCAHLF
jgi:hypothetical protein